MNQLSLREALPQLSQIAGMTGMPVGDARVTLYINNAIRELMMTGDYPGVVDRYHVRYDQATGHVALPYTLDRLMQATVDHCPAMIASPWMEYVAAGPGYVDDYDVRGRLRYNWTSDILDKGEMPVQTPIPNVDVATGPWVLRVYAQVDEDVASVAPTINFQGLDADGLIIRTLSDGTADSYYNGLNVPIDFSVPYTQTTQQFSKINSVAKPVTRGYVRVTAWNGTVEVEISNYAWNEQAPSYRHYYIGRLHNRGHTGLRPRILLARCRKRYVPVSEPNDILILGNVEALAEMMIGQYKRKTDNESFMMHRQSAIDIMKAEAMGYAGKARVPAISFQRGYPLGSMPSVR